MTTALSWIVLGYANSLGGNSPVGSDPYSLLTLNLGLIQLQAQRYGYTYTPEIGAHKVHTQAKSWNMARHACEEEGAHLAVINSRAEAEVVGQLIRQSGQHYGSRDSNYAGIGFHGLYGRGDWVTIFGDSLTEAGYDVWLPGEPNDAGGKENCGSIHVDGKLNDGSCENLAGFVCELPYRPTYTLHYLAQPTAQVIEQPGIGRIDAS